MKQKAEIERLVQLAEELQAAGNARPYNPDEYNRIIDEFNKLFQPGPAVPKKKLIVRIIRSIRKRAPSQFSYLG